jgi:hypothetical protein
VNAELAKAGAVHAVQTGSLIGARIAHTWFAAAASGFTVSMTNARTLAWVGRSCLVSKPVPHVSSIYDEPFEDEMWPREFLLERLLPVSAP